MNAASLRCLGPFQATVQGQGTVALHGRKAAALLVYLALEGQWTHSRATLSALLWPALPEMAARNNLRVALARLCSVFGHELIHSDRLSLQLGPWADLEVDALRFQALVRQTREHAHADRATCEDGVARLREADALYQGEFLAELGLEDCPDFQDWVVARREDFRLAALEVLTDLGAHDEARGDLRGAEGHTRRLLALEPLHEAGCRRLLRLLAGQGRRNEALETYLAYRGLLRRELDVAPDSATALLAAQIAQGEVRSPAAPAGWPTRAAGWPPLLERDPEAL